MPFLLCFDDFLTFVLMPFLICFDAFPEMKLETRSFEH